MDKKRIYIVLLLMTIFVLAGLLAGAWYIRYLDSSILNDIMFNSFYLIVGILLVLFVLAVGVLIVTLIREKNYSSMNKIMRFAIDAMFPISLLIGKMLGMEKDKIKSSYINVCNQVVKTKKYNYKEEDILVLAPHCLQNTKCPHKITINIENCKQCGLCPIGDLLRLKKERNIDVVVATGGTFARKFIKEKRPKAIIAVACERDLTSGIQDVKRIPVLGVLNQRPEGPCYNTLVSIEEIEKAIDFFLEEGGGNRLNDGERSSVKDCI